MPQPQIKVTCKTADSLPLEKIVAFQGELKELREADFKKLKASIIKYGLSFPSYVWRSNGAAKCLDGHQRSRVLNVMKEEGYKIPPVPVVYVDAKTEKEAKEKILLLSSQYGKYTMDSVYEFLNDADIDFGDMKDIIDLPQFDLDKFEQGYFTDPVEEGPEPRFDEAEQLRKKYGVELGQVWTLGEHRLACGDSTSKEHVEMLLNGARPFLMVTDPPYGVDYDPAWRRNIRGCFADVIQDGLVNNDDRADWSDVWKLSPSIVAYVWHGALHSAIVAANLQTAKYAIRAQIIWQKQMAPMTRGHYRWQHEPCWYGARGSSKWRGDLNESTIWEIKNLNPVGGGGRDDKKLGHGTQKPIECMARPIRNHGGKDDDVYDPFLGSGTTLIACEQLGRKCYAMEISESYTAVALQRWVDLTGKEPHKIG